MKPFRFHIRCYNKTANQTSSTNSTANSKSAEVNQHRQNRNKDNFRSRDSNPPQHYSSSRGDRQPWNCSRPRDPSGRCNRSPVDHETRVDQPTTEYHMILENIATEHVTSVYSEIPVERATPVDHETLVGHATDHDQSIHITDPVGIRPETRVDIGMIIVTQKKTTGLQLTDGKNSEMRVYQQKHYVQPDYRDTREEHHTGRYSAPSYNNDVLVHNGPPIHVLHKNETQRMNVNTLPFRPLQYTPQLNLQHGQMMYQPTHSIPQLHYEY